ncbi:MAG: S1 RNA-binding domain-containing protein [archaeon]
MLNKIPEQDELVLCTVDRIIETSVFVKIDSYGREGVISTSEIAPGRIRNLRDYVRPKKKIVCKILRISQDGTYIDLSLRRVTQKEAQKVMDDFERERNDIAILKTILKEKVSEIVENIKKNNQSVTEFLQSAKEEDFKKVGFGKEQTDQIIKIINDKPEKKVYVKAKMTMSSESGDGVVKIKNILSQLLKTYKNLDINYLSAPNYSISVESTDYKTANTQLDAIISKILEQSKSAGIKTEIIKS